MNSERSTRPTPERQKAGAWEWREGPVDKGSDYFEVRYGKAFDSSVDTWILVAMVGLMRKGLINVQFLIDSGDPRNSKMVEDTVKELNFYIIELQEEDAWRYLQYHCTTMSDVYSIVHWSFMTGNEKSAEPL